VSAIGRKRTLAVRSSRDYFSWAIFAPAITAWDSCSTSTPSTCATASSAS